LALHDIEMRRRRQASMTTTSELRSQLESKGEEISNLTHQIEERIESYVDWQGIVRERPLQSVGIAALAGLVISGSTGPIMKVLGKQVIGLAQAGITTAIVAALSKPESSVPQA
jgi:hypothetical protein